MNSSTHIINNINRITDDQALHALCEQLKKVDAIAIDTEFVRERTYYPAIGLIQLYDGEQVYLVDPLTINDWSAFVDILENEKIVKVIHSCSEDVEVFKTALKCRPKALYDTQIAEAFCGGQNAAGLAVLVEKYTHVKLDKGHARTNWLLRPLSDEQLVYAASDVLYLLAVYHAQIDQLTTLESSRLNNDSSPFLACVYDDVDVIMNKKFQPLIFENAWRDIKSAWQLSPRALSVLKELVAWRLTVATERDLAVNFVVKERTLLVLAESRPNSLSSMRNLSEIHPMEIKRHGQALLACIAAGKAIDETECPARIKRVAEISGYKKYYSALKAQVALSAKKVGVSVELFASKRMINQVLAYHWKIAPWSLETEPELFLNWRGAASKADLLTVLSELDT